ncbi:hypothetical protein MMC2321_04120 [Chitinophaga sp. MM2321]
MLMLSNEEATASFIRRNIYSGNIKYPEPQMKLTERG